MCLREDSCQQLLTVWRKNGLYAVKLCGHFFCVMARMAQRAHRRLWSPGVFGGGALRLLRATKSRSAVAPVSGSATGGSSVVNKLTAGRTNRRYCYRFATFLRGFPRGGALRLLWATKSRSAVAPVSGSATGGSSVVNKLKAGRTNRRPGKAQPPPGIYPCRRYFSAPVLLF